MAYNRTDIIIQIALYFSLAISCGRSGQDDLETARKAAVKHFELFMYHDRIDLNLFEGPTLVYENQKEYLFRWFSTVPRPGATIIEVDVPKDRNQMLGFQEMGPRPRIDYLLGSNHLPVNQAALRNLFHLPENPEIKNDNILRLSFVLLDTSQLEDIANFVEIGWDLSGYAYCFNCKFPDSLDDLFNNIRGDCKAQKVDSIYMRDRYNHTYFYENLINFIVLGTPGENRIWDFDKAIMDSIFNDQKEHIYVKDDDIIVKFSPFTQCN